MLDPSMKARAQAAGRLRAEPVARLTTVGADGTAIRVRPARARVG